jgi:retinol dehydrogenase-12
MGALTILGGTSALLTTSIYLFRRRLSKDWLTSNSITHPITLTKKHTIIITGGNVGLGYETALDLASRGAQIVLGCRNLVDAQKAVGSIRAHTNNDDVSCLELDLSSLSSVRKFATDIKQRHENLYALICNAGVWVPMDQQRKTQDGYELHFGVNHLGHFLLIQELLPVLKKSEDSRVVLVSSSLSKHGKVNMERKEFVYDGRMQSEKSYAPSGYCDSKLMNALTARQLAKELKDFKNVTAYAVCPGFCKSQLGRHINMPSYKRVITGSMMRLFQRSAVQGAQNIVFSTVTDKDELVNGGFYQDGKVNEEMMGSHLDVEKSLWDLTVELIR